MTPEQLRSTSPSPANPLDGEIIALEEDCVRVRLESGVVGTLARDENSQTQSPFTVGQHHKFNVLQCDESGKAVLCLVAGQDTDVSQVDKDDNHQQQKALTHRTSLAAHEDEGFPTLDEQRIQQWLNRVEKNLTKLRRNRSKRLDEEFYSG